MARGVKANGKDGSITFAFKPVENGTIITANGKTYCAAGDAAVATITGSIIGEFLNSSKRVTKRAVTKKHAGGRPKGSKNKPVQTDLFQPPAAIPTPAAAPAALPPELFSGKKRRTKKFTTTAVEAPPAQG